MEGLEASLHTATARMGAAQSCLADERQRAAEARQAATEAAASAARKTHAAAAAAADKVH